MINSSNRMGLTRKDLVKATACPPYLIRYYAECGYLPVIKQSSGPGVPTIFHPDAVLVIKQRMALKSSDTILDDSQHSPEQELPLSTVKTENVCG